MIQICHYVDLLSAIFIYDNISILRDLSTTLNINWLDKSLLILAFYRFWNSVKDIL